MRKFDLADVRKNEVKLSTGNLVDPHLDRSGRGFSAPYDVCGGQRKMAHKSGGWPITEG